MNYHRLNKLLVYHGLNKSQQKEKIEFFEGRKERKHKKQNYLEYYIPKKENQRKTW